MATANLPAWGYGIRYQYGMFRQTLVDGFQHEQPDYWLMFGNPWEIERLHVTYTVQFYGHVSVHDRDGRQMFQCAPLPSPHCHTASQHMAYSGAVGVPQPPFSSSDPKLCASPSTQLAAGSARRRPTSRPLARNLVS